MAKQVTKSQPQPETEVAKAQAKITNPEIVVGDVLHVRGKAGKQGAAAMIKGDTKAMLSRRAELLGEVSQRVAELQDAEKELGEQSDEVKSLTARITNSLYQGRIENVLSAELVSAELGRYFGFAPKQDGTPGKTPDGTGAVIRRRLVRGVAAHNFVHNGDGGAFFEGVDPKWTVSDDDPRTVADLVEAVEKGEITLWTAHDLFQKIKSNNAERPELAYDAKRINNLTQKLLQSVEASAQLFASDANLVLAYSDLVEAWQMVDARAGEILAEAE